MSSSATARSGMQIAEPVPEPVEPSVWIRRIAVALADLRVDALDVAETALCAWPAIPEIALMTALAAIAGGQPTRATSLLKRFRKDYGSHKAGNLLTALALAQLGHAGRARTMLKADGIDGFSAAADWFVGPRGMLNWLRDRLSEISGPPVRPQAHIPAPRARATRPPSRPAPPLPTLPSIPDLKRLEASFAVQIEIAEPPEIQLAGSTAEPVWFRLRRDLTRLALFEGFDELLCLPALHGVETHWHQVETVRKVLKQYRGRVLLADEVGLGKTVEAGMVVKEYVLRGMAERILILTPAALVGQWRDGWRASSASTAPPATIRCCEADPDAFWAQPRVIASIAAARRKDHAERLAALTYDVVVVDEAHHLRDQSSASYRLIDSLSKRFLLLLSATPVQNNLLELYNLLDAAEAWCVQDTEGVSRRLHGSRQAAGAGQPRPAARADARRDGAQHPRAGGAAPAAPAIEQRIDRIGQTREVFVFNLVTTETIEDAVLRILDEKINMFELVVGEVGAILGEFDEQNDFSTLVLDAWLRDTEATRAAAFAELEGQLVAARQHYEGAKALDEALFGNELDAA